MNDPPVKTSSAPWPRWFRAGGPREWVKFISQRMTPKVIGMLMRLFLLLWSTVVVAGFATAQQPAYPPSFDGARVETYKSADDVTLRLWGL